MPLLLVAVTPLLIGAFAFNFNNFTLIDLVTRRRTSCAEFRHGVRPAKTDILISYSYRVGISLRAPGNDYAFAATISIFIFVIIGLDHAHQLSASVRRVRT